MTVCPVDQEITDSIDSLHLDLFTSLQKGTSTLATFLSSWQSFELKIEACANTLQDETLDRVYNFSTIVASVVNGAAQALSVGQEVCNEVAKEIDEVISTGIGEQASGKREGIRSQTAYISLVRFQKFRLLNCQHTSSLRPSGS